MDSLYIPEQGSLWLGPECFRIARPSRIFWYRCRVAGLSGRRVVSKEQALRLTHRLQTPNTGFNSGLLLSQSSEVGKEAPRRSLVLRAGPPGSQGLACRVRGTSLNSTSYGFKKGIKPISLTNNPNLAPTFGGLRQEAQGPGLIAQNRVNT